jgi:chemotaxis response regulator CheB
MRTNDFIVVGVGASAGGHSALKEFFAAIPVDIPAAFVVITHLRRGHKSELAKIISRFTKLRVERISHLVLAEPGTVYVLPENQRVKIKGTTLMLTTRPKEEQTNNAIDFFFKSLAADQQQNSIGVILSGMGTDGAEGATTIFEQGGTVFVQAPSSTSFQSMPCATIMKDHPEFVLPPSALGAKLASFIHAWRKQMINV